MAARKPIGTFVRNHPKTGQPQERDAYTPAEAVQLRSDGWTEKRESGTAKAADTHEPAAGRSRPGGKSA